jgi:hypothetical protein
MGAVRPYVTRHPGDIIREAFSESIPFDSYISSICRELILFREIVISDPIPGILNAGWDDEHLSTLAPALLHSVAVLEPLIDKGYVHVLSLTNQDVSKQKEANFRALYKAAYGEGVTFGHQRRDLESLADQITVKTRFSSQLQVFFSSNGLSLYKRAADGRAVSMTDPPLPARPRFRLTVPSPDRVAIDDILQIRESGKLEQWLSELNQSVAIFTQLGINDPSDAQVLAEVQQHLRSGQQDLRHAVEQLERRSSIRGIAREILIGLMSAVPGLYWSPGVYAQTAAGAGGFAAVNVARNAISDRGKRESGAALLRHYDAFFACASSY